VTDAVLTDEEIAELVDSTDLLRHYLARDLQAARAAVKKAKLGYRVIDNKTVEVAEISIPVDEWRQALGRAG
jgi:hypothetical protein